MAFIPGSYASLNNATFSELSSSLGLIVGNGLTITSSGYVVSQVTGVGLANYDNWVGTLGSPDVGDIVSFNTFTTGNPAGIITYTETLGDGSTQPASGGIGAKVIAYNSTGVLIEQLAGYAPGSNPVIAPDGTYFLLTEPSVDLSYTDGSGGPSAAALTFSTASTVPEPSAALLMPMMVIGLLIARLPSVRAFLRTF